jgi:hypothetical protein
MNLEKLDNLVKINKLKLEPPDQREFDGMVASAKRGLQDAKVDGLSEEGKFSMLYGAAHSISLAAMRWHGYRSDNRYLVFQCLQHTIDLNTVKWRVLDRCHKTRNLAEYEGRIELAPQLLKELLEITEELVTLVVGLGRIPE